MAKAEVGDDVMGEDPTMNRLQELAAERLGKEAALFMASGTMANFVALLSHCDRGDGALMGNRSHTYLNEGGGASALGGIYLLPLPTGADGTLDLEAIERALPTQDIHHPNMRLVCLENTHNYCGGVPLSVAYTQAVADLVHSHGLLLHLDGARIFNAALSLDVSPAELVAPADSVMFCLSKGLSCPVGSMLCGTREFIERARRMRKMVGGGMRQVGVLAAAGIVALEEMVDRMRDDHENARLLAQGMAELPSICVETDPVQTNILFFEHQAKQAEVDRFVSTLAEEAVLLFPSRSGRFRAVTHYGIERDDIHRALDVMRRALHA
jgi:threonine aldolase